MQDHSVTTELPGYIHMYVLTGKLIRIHTEQNDIGGAQYAGKLSSPYLACCHHACLDRTTALFELAHKDCAEDCTFSDSMTSHEKGKLFLNGYLHE